MNKPMRAIPTILLLALAAACGPPQAGSLTPYHGTLRSSCAPHDAPSVELQLASLTGPETMYFNLWPSTPVRPPTTVRFDALHPTGAATVCVAGGDCEAAEWGDVQLSSSGQDASVTGKWTIGLAGGRILQGAFEADWLAIQAFCG